jgi:hypothetical protein
MTKQCKTCKEPKPLVEFRFNTKGKYSWHENNCKKCNLERGKERNQQFPRIRKNGILKRKFGITIEDFDALLERQNGKCAICEVPHDLVKYGLRVDHDHKTGKVRSLLCDTCNKGLGYFKDSSTLIQKAIDYLLKFVKITPTNPGDTL